MKPFTTLTVGIFALIAHRASIPVDLGYRGRCGRIDVAAVGQPTRPNHSGGLSSDALAGIAAIAGERRFL